MLDNTGAAEEYKNAVKLAKRYMSRNAGQPFEGELPVLEIMLPGYMELGGVKLGVVDVPLNKVRGTVTAGRAPAFAGNFMPLLPEASEFAQKWVRLYDSHVREGVREPGIALEYLGYYYVIEGHKRVSVLLAAGASSIHLDVTRLLPKPVNEEAEIYLEWLQAFPHDLVVNMWMSERGRFTELKELSQLKTLSEDNERRMIDAYEDFRRCYHELGLKKLPITTGDAFLTFVKLYGFPYDWDKERLTSRVKELERQLQYQARCVITGRGVRPKAHHAIFVYDDAPGASYWDTIHDYGRRVLTQVFPEARVECVTGLRDNPDAVLQSVCAQESVVFVTGIDRKDAALRALLSQRESLVCQCRPEPDDTVLPSYYGRTAEPAFVLGALAGSLTCTGKLGAVEAPGFLTYRDIDAFALGARMVNSRSSVLMRKWQFTEYDDELVSHRVALSALGCDMVLLPYLCEGMGGRGFPGVFARLASLSLPYGHVTEYLGAAAWNFGSFYATLCASLWQEGDGILKDVSPGYQPLHFEAGLDSGILNVHIYDAALKRSSRMLVETMTKIVKAEGIPLSSDCEILVIDAK